LRLLVRVPDELEPRPDEQERDRRPDTEPRRVGKDGASPAGEEALEHPSECIQRADEVPDVGDEHRDEAEPDPEVDPDEDRHRILEEGLLAKETADDRDHEEERRKCEPNRAQVKAAEGVVEVMTRPVASLREGECRRRCRGDHCERAGEGVEPDRKRRAVVDSGGVRGGHLG